MYKLIAKLIDECDEIIFSDASDDEYYLPAS